MDHGAPPESMPHPRGYVCYRSPGPIAVDGRLDDPAWEAAPWSEPHRDIEGGLKPEPPLRTREKMLWDDEYLYIAADLEEPHVWATLTEHDSVIFQDNDFEVFIDPDGDNQQYYEVEVNAFGTWWDLLLTKAYKDGGTAVNGWEIPGIKVATHVAGTINDPTDIGEGWTVEVALPWKALSECAHRPAPPEHGDQWRINFSRVEWDVAVESGRYVKLPGRKENNWVWSPQGVIDMHRPETWGYVQFSTAEPGSDRFRPDPAWPARWALHRIYYAQHAFRKETGRWASPLDEQALAASADLQPEIYTTPSLFEAAIRTSAGAGKAQILHIAADGRIWSDD